MIKRLPKFSESTLETLCADAGALSQKVSEDESGWDYLIEFPEEPHVGPADTRPARKRAYVQVKSAQAQGFSCRIKLSNALRAAQDPHPWFVVLMVRGKRKRNVNVYAVHVWESLVRRTLEAVRRAENEGRSLNRATLTIEVEEVDRGDDLIDWMRMTIAEVGSEYEQVKKKNYETVGYEDGHGTGQLTIQASNIDEIMRNFLGLGSGLDVKRFVFTPARFGLHSPTPEIDLYAGKIHITPDPVGTCEIWLRGPLPSEPIVLTGKAYSLSFPGIKEEERTVRFSAEFLEMLWTPKGDKTNCDIKLDAAERTTLYTLEKLATLKGWLDAGSIDLQVWVNDKRFVSGSLNRNVRKVRTEWVKLAHAIKLLRTIAGPTRQSLIMVSLKELYEAPGLRTFHSVMENGSFRLEFEPHAGSPDEVSSLVYYSSVEIGPHLFFALVERRVVEDIMVEGCRRITTGEPLFVESYALTSASEQQRGGLESDYKEFLARREKSEHPLGLGNVQEFIASLLREREESGANTLPDHAKSQPIQ